MTKAKPFTLTDSEVKILESVARRSAFKWRYVDREDLEQSLYLWAYSHPEQVERFRGLENSEAAFVLSLKREANRYCAKETAVCQGAELSRFEFEEPV